MNSYILIIIVAFVVIALGYVAVKNKKHEPDYRTFFYIGIVWIIFGFIPDNTIFLMLGTVFMLVGFVNKKKWKEKTDIPKKKMIFNMLLVAGLLALVLVTGLFIYQKKSNNRQIAQITNFMECANAGNPVMESYPRQCRAGDETFIENIGNELEKMNLIRIDTPRPNQSVESPLVVEGQAVGTWFFEGDFPVILTDWDGRIIGEGFATAVGNSMTEEFVPFSAVIEFETPSYKNNGMLILRKDNPSDLPENDDALEVPVIFK